MIPGFWSTRILGVILAIKVHDCVSLIVPFTHRNSRYLHVNGIFVAWLRSLDPVASRDFSARGWFLHRRGLEMEWPSSPGGCFTNVSRALQSNLTKICSAIIYIYGASFKLKLCICDQSMALGTRTKFQLGIVKRITISAIHKFREYNFENSWNVIVKQPPGSSMCDEGGMELTVSWSNHRSMTSKSLMSTAPSCIDNSWRSTTLSVVETYLMNSELGVVSCPFHPRFIVRCAGHMRSQQDPEMWWSVPFPCAWLYMSFILFCLICVYSSQFSILFWIMYLL